MRTVCTFLLLLALASPLAAQPFPAGPPARIAEEGLAHPVWSPDGSRLALTTAGYDGLWVMDVATGAVAPVTDEGAAGFGVQWSGDGSALLARVAQYDGPRRSNGVKVFDLASGEARLVAPYRPQMPTLPRWSPDNARVFLAENGRLATFASGLTPSLGKASEAPVLLIHGEGIARADAASGRVVALDVLPEARILNVTPSPDGQRVAFEVMGGNLFVMNADGTGLTDLGRGEHPTWSPDGEWVAFMVTRDDGHALLGSDLWVARVDGSARTALTDTADRMEMYPAWSPDGRAIAFDEFSEGAVYVLPIRF